jgi:hypothetical protein
VYGRRVEWGRVFFKLGYEFEADRSDGEDLDTFADSGVRDRDNYYHDIKHPNSDPNLWRGWF